MDCQLSESGTKQSIQPLRQQVGGVDSALGILHHEESIVIGNQQLYGRSRRLDRLSVPQHQFSCTEFVQPLDTLTDQRIVADNHQRSTARAHIPR